MNWTMQQHRASDSIADALSGARCVNGHLMRPMLADGEPPSTACRPNVVNAPGVEAPQDLVNLQAEFHLIR